MARTRRRRGGRQETTSATEDEEEVEEEEVVGGGCLLQISTVWGFMDYLSPYPPTPPPVNPHPLLSGIVLTRKSVPVGPGLGGVGGHGCHITLSKEALGASGVLSY